MSHPVASISGVVDRIQRIEARFDRERPGGATEVVTVGERFDPFGAAYQRALAARPTAPASAPSAIEGPHRLVELRPSTVAPATGGSPSGLGGIAVPPALAPYGNGQIPRDALQPIAQSGHRLWAPAAQAWDDLVDAAARAGFDLRITDSYRSYEEQVDLARRKGLYADGGLAAVPGTSNHGWGLAVDADVRDPALLEWLRQNGPAFGWVERVPREPWHWEFRPPSA